MPYLVMLVSREERHKILGAGYECVDAREVDETLVNQMSLAIWLPGDPMDWLVLDEEEENG